jgi:hypothetical protein
MTVPEEWGKPARVVLPDAVLTDPPLVIYQDVLVARDPVCSRLTRVKHDKKSKSTAVSDPTDADRVVITVHLGVDRLERLRKLEKRWDGCISASFWVCHLKDWETLKSKWESTPGLYQHVTLHAVVGHDAYPYNVMRNVALAPFSPWALSGGRPAPWVFVLDADCVPSVSEQVMSKVRACAVCPLRCRRPTLTFFSANLLAVDYRCRGGDAHAPRAAARRASRSFAMDDKGKSLGPAGPRPPEGSPRRRPR